jgi:small subunit ribosomal protein S17
MADADTKRIIRRVGEVKTDGMTKSIVVRVERKVMHPIYKKYVKRYTTLLAHDEENEAKAGDKVEIEFTRPMSKRKRWKLVRVVVAAAGGAA